MLVGASLSCALRLDAPPPRAAEEFTEGRALVDLELLAERRAAADADPDHLEAQWKAGMAHLRASLQGHVDQRDHAERYLERAWRLDPEGERVPAARVLARFLNMRSSVLDVDKIGLQIELYESLLRRGEGEAGADPRAFHYASFIASARALARFAEGEELAALRRVEALEREMWAHLREHPDDVDTHAMAGNFELTFAGVVPVGRRRRLAEGVEHLAVQQDRWAELSPRARSTTIAPNVRSVFLLYLAEGLLAAGEREAAAARYRQLIDLDDQPDTAPRRQLVALAEHRLAKLDAYAGELELLPPWPAGVTGCVACHAREAALPTDDLYLVDLGPEEGGS